MDLYPDDRYLTAIARRNTTWAAWQNVRDRWVAAGRPTGPTLQAVNAAQDAYEWAARELIRARVIWKREVPMTKAA